MIDLSKIWPEWKIEKRIGRGAYGEVYQAVRNDYGIETKAAIKIISVPSDDVEVDELFYEGLTQDDAKTYLKSVVDECVSEIRLMETLKDNANVVNIEDYKVIPKEEGIGWDIYIRMELLTPLNEFLCDKKLSEEEIIKLGVDISNALEVCEFKNIIHRDIKPENIMVNSFGDFKLGDFGIARNFESMTYSLSRKGTMNYMAPEVANGSSDYDIRVDIYSLGLVLYKLLNNNRMPFLESEKQLLSPMERKSATERRLKGEKLPKPAACSDKLANIILKACDPNPDKRYKSPKKMKEDLNFLLYKKPEEPKEVIIISAPPEQEEEPKKFKLKSRDYILIFTALLLLLIIEGFSYFSNRTVKPEQPVTSNEVSSKTSTSTTTSINIDLDENKKIVDEAKERFKKHKENNPYFYSVDTYESLVEEGCTDYEMYLIAQEMKKHKEYFRAAEIIAKVIAVPDFYERFCSPNSMQLPNAYYSDYTREFYLAGSTVVMHYSKETSEDWNCIDWLVPYSTGRYEAKIDKDGIIIGIRDYTYSNSKVDLLDISDVSNEDYARGVALINKGDYEEAIKAFKLAGDYKYAKVLISLCNYNIGENLRSPEAGKYYLEAILDEEFLNNYFIEYNQENENDYELYRKYWNYGDNYEIVEFYDNALTGESYFIVNDRKYDYNGNLY